MANPLKSPNILTSIPPLENGDRLTRPEFERRYNQMPNVKAELIEGVVYMPAALRFKSHAQPHGNLMIWLGFYKVMTSGVELGDNPTIRLDLDNEPQPDAVLFINENCGGKVKITEDDYLEGSPELVAEIAASSVSIDLGDKKRVYRRNGVQEYLVWQSYENQFNWFVLENGEYIQLQPDDAGIIRSRVFPGLWLAVNELLAGNMKQVLQVLQRGLDSEEHQAFLNR
jgi:Uma2 family endonuclease